MSYRKDDNNEAKTDNNSPRNCIKGVIESSRQPRMSREEDNSKEKKIGIGEKKVFGTFSALASSSHQKKGIGLSEDRIKEKNKKGACCGEKTPKPGK